MRLCRALSDKIRKSAYLLSHSIPWNWWIINLYNYNYKKITEGVNAHLLLLCKYFPIISHSKECGFKYAHEKVLCLLIL